MTETMQPMEPTKRRGPIYAEYRGPGPLAYEKKTTIGPNGHCPTKKQAPAFSFGTRWREIDDYRPGPSYSYNSNLTARGSANPPSFSLQSRPKIKPIEITPGPGSYNTQAVKRGAQSKENNAPSVSIGQRTNWPFKNEAPPPNSYTIKTGVGSRAFNEKFTPSWSFGGKSEFGSTQYAGIKAGNPGPGAYGSTEPNTFKSSAGSYSMQGRTKMKDYNTVKDNPGPGAYEPKKAEPGRRGCSLGTRHSEYTVPFITDVDVL